MIDYKKVHLSNGLKLLIHEDITNPMCVVNVLYDVGARDENPEQTGFAHLFEHLMFGGSVNIPVYDEPLQRVGGENNAFTSNDITNYYIQIPSQNFETALWLESDRMLNLAFSEKSLEVQKNVVCEEFKQRYLNQPYGDVWLLLRELVYQVHPYRWATIGKELSHIENAEIDDVKAFFKKHYNPQNAIVVIAGNVNTSEIEKQAEKWFGSIPQGEKYVRNLPQEPKQTEAKTKTVYRDVPADAIYKVFHMSNRKSREYYVSDLMSDILSRGNSSRLHQSLLKEQKLFSEINAYVSGDMDAGMFIVEGKLSENISVEIAEKAIMKELNQLISDLVPENELQKVKNKSESTFIFGEMSLLNKAMNLAYYELMGDAKRINTEIEIYQSITADEIKNQAAILFDERNSSTLYYLKN